MRKLLLITSLFLTSILNAQNSISTDSLERKLKIYFETVKPELFRYSGLAFYGEEQTNFSKNQIDKELNLYRQIKNSALINKPTSNVFALCHNILIHSQDTGRLFLKELNKPTKNENILGNIITEIIFTGEYGEKLALDNLESKNEEWSETWSGYLSLFSIYESSLERIIKVFDKTKSNAIKENLIDAIMYIGNPDSKGLIKNIIETTIDDDIQTKAIFAFAELGGYESIKYLQSVKTVGQKSKDEKKSSISWLKKETSAKNKFGIEVSNDIDFINRFGDIKSPAIVWLDKKGLLNDKVVTKPKQMINEDKNEILNLLLKSKGFGIEAVKAQLFLSIQQSDLDKLLELRQVCNYSPSSFTKGRQKTLGILIRYLRKTRS
jgi:hypothetical protein